MVRFSDFPYYIENVTPIEKTSVTDAVSVYNETVVCLREIYNRFSQEKKINIEDVSGLIEKLVDKLSSADDTIIFLTSRIYIEEHLLYHTVNVVILSIKIGLYFKYPTELLVNLGVLALLHGISGLEEGHTVQELEKQKFIQSRQSKESSVKEALSIIAIIDVYESLTHSRPYRTRFMPFEVLKAIIATGEGIFNAEIVKEILKVFSVYPLGSIVRLDTEETAQVIKINRDFPLRPEVLIITDSEGNELKEKKTIDLSSHPNRYIKGPAFL